MRVGLVWVHIGRIARREPEPGRPRLATMHDDKRFLRNLKRQIKKSGNRKRRRYLKDVEATADDFELGRDRTHVMNERPKRPKWVAGGRRGQHKTPG